MATAKYRHVTVLCPANVTTGGPEALHQLVWAIRSLGGSASICYRNGSSTNVEIPAPYRVYETPVVDEPIEGSDCALVAPEIWPDELRRSRCGTRILWWLSVDHFLNGSGARTRAALRLAARMPRRLADAATWRIVNASSAVRQRWPSARVRSDWLHFVQSHYAGTFVRERLGETPWLVTDFLSRAHESVSHESVRDDDERAPSVAYNPAKGGELTARIRDACPHLEFVPISGLTPTQVSATLQRSTIYIDFGEHPGRDRLPREAARNGAVVIVGRRGSAAFAEDCPLPDAYRVHVNPLDVAELRRMLDAIVAEPATHQRRQQGYRRWVAGDRERFLDEVRRTLFTGGSGS